MPRFPRHLEDLRALVLSEKAELKGSSKKSEDQEIRAHFPNCYSRSVLSLKPTEGSVRQRQALRVAAVLSGGPAPGGHNVIWGLFNGLKQYHQDCELLGVLGGPDGLLRADFVGLNKSQISDFRNTGGFDLLGSGRAKIERPEDLQKVASILERQEVDALIIIGGDDSNTNAMLMAEYFKSIELGVRVIGVPKTIDGDLKNDFVATSFGFDTAVRVYSELISNIARDTLSQKKYYHFIRLMGRAASHITLEAALQTQPNFVLISEEFLGTERGLRDIVEELCSVIIERSKKGKNYGIVLLAEGVVEFIPEIKSLLCELNALLVEHRDYFETIRGFTRQAKYVNQKLSKDSSYTFSSLPIDIQRQMLMERDPHGNVIVSQIEIEKLLIELLQGRLRELKVEGKFDGNFAYQRHFLGYEGRCAAPTNFDADYAYSLGLTTAALVCTGANACMAAVKNIQGSHEDWEGVGIPLSSLMCFEHRHGRRKAVIKRTLVDLQGAGYKYYLNKKEKWSLGDCYRFTGPIQYFGPQDLVEQIPISLRLDASEECR